MEKSSAGQKRVPTSIRVPARTLLVLCGPAGSGKSSFAAQRFGATTIVSSDHCREMICDDVNNQQVNRDTFDLFYYIIHKRLFQGRFTVADSTALYPEARRRLLELARRHGYFACLLIFDVSEATCTARNLLRERKVEARVMPYHANLLRQTLESAPNENWDAIYVLAEDDEALVEVSS